MEREAVLVRAARSGAPFSAFLRGLRLLRVESPAPRPWLTPFS